MLVLLHTLLVVTALAWVVRHPRGWGAAIFATACAAVEVLGGAAPPGLLGVALRAAGPLAMFLTAAIWLSAFAERTGLARRLADGVARAAGHSRAMLYVLVSALCALLTATVSLDGAVVLMVPVLLALTRRTPELLRPLLLGTIGVANAFSLALPQGNPANLIVMERLGLGPGEFIAHLFLPSVLATLVCVGAVALVQRRVLRGRYALDAVAPGPWSGAERLAAAGLVAAGVLGAAAPWLGIAPWWPICGVAAAVFVAAFAGGCARATPRIPVRVCVQVAALVVLVGSLAGTLSIPVPAATSLGALILLALVASAIAGAVNNLPASVVLSGILGSHSLPACAALTGLSVGSLATPHGSVATILAVEGAGECGTTAGHLRLWLPAAATATAVAVGALWLL
jgi:arsenical pump membrane protein